MKTTRIQHTVLQGQSKAILLLVLPLCSLYLLLHTASAVQRRDPAIFTACGISIAFGLAVWMARAGTPLAVLTGALITACLYLRTPGWHSALFPLLATLFLTFAATRIGRRHKEQVGSEEEKHGRNAAQVAANLGVAALACLPLTAAQLFTPSPKSSAVALIALGAALAEATADTLSSELGIVFGGEPRLITTFRRVPRGTDGGITMAGTLCGMAGAAIVSVIAALTFVSGMRAALMIFAGGVFGLLADSFLGAILERRGWLNNDAVNFLSTLAAALLGATIAAHQ